MGRFSCRRTYRRRLTRTAEPLPPPAPPAPLPPPAELSIALAISLKLSLSDVARPFNAVMIATAISAAIKPYSIAVAPFSS